MATWTVAKGILNDADKARLACVYFHDELHANVNWDAAAADYGSTSTNSFRTMIYAAVKKVKEAAANGEGGTPDTPKAATTTAKRGRKRKEANGATPDTPAPKKSRAKKKKAEVTVSVETGVENDEEKVKEEAAEDSA